MPAIAIFQTAMDSNETIIWCVSFIFFASDGGVISPFLEQLFADVCRILTFQGCQHVVLHAHGVTTCDECSYLARFTWRSPR